MSKDAIDPIDLRERIALCKDFTPLERDLILDSMALNRYSDKHEYPSKYLPGSSPIATLTWALLDQLPPDAMTKTHRFMLAGLFGGALKDICEQAGMDMVIKQ